MIYALVVLVKNIRNAMANKLILTLCIIHQGKRILLGYKKRGFGMHKWNGFGGKLEVGESIEEAAIREVKEESGLAVRNLRKLGVLTFKFIESGKLLEGHLFKAVNFEGEPIETDEMKPRWFKMNEIPFSNMWPDDKYWFPLFLNGNKFFAEFTFDGQENIIKYKIKKVKNFRF